MAPFADEGPESTPAKVSAVSKPPRAKHKARNSDAAVNSKPRANAKRSAKETVKSEPQVRAKRKANSGEEVPTKPRTKRQKRAKKESLEANDDDAADSEAGRLRRSGNIGSCTSSRSLKPTGPCCIQEELEWASSGMMKVLSRLGRDAVSRVGNLCWSVSTCFSGMGCPEIAILMLRAAATQMIHNAGMHGSPQISFGPCTDVEPACQRLLQAMFPGRCVFGDISEWRARKGGMFPAVLLREDAECHAHGQRCPLLAPIDRGLRVMIAGPPCVFFSKMGKGLGMLDERSETHVLWAQHVRDTKYDIVIFENTPTYPVQNLKDQFGADYEVRWKVVDPRQFGFNVARERVMAILTRRSSVRWVGPELSEALSLFEASVSVHGCDQFFRLHDEEVATSHGKGWQPDRPSREFLSKSELRHLDGYKADPRFSHRGLWDLAQNPATRPRTSRVDESLPTLTTSSGRLFSHSRGRWLLPEELLLAMGVPAVQRFARLPLVPWWNLDAVSPAISANKRVTMAGNGMHVPCIGYIILVAMLYAQPIDG